MCTILHTVSVDKHWIITCNVCVFFHCSCTRLGVLPKTNLLEPHLKYEMKSFLIFTVKTRVWFQCVSSSHAWQCVLVFIFITVVFNHTANRWLYHLSPVLTVFIFILQHNSWDHLFVWVYWLGHTTICIWCLFVEIQSVIRCFWNIFS